MVLPDRRPTRGYSLVEGGSSGGGIFNSNGQLAGQLLGRCSDFSDPDDMNCSNIDSFRAMYGEFETTSPHIENTLAIGGTMWVNSASTPPGAGTPSWPYSTIGLAQTSAWSGLNIRIIAGGYSETPTLNKQLTLTARGGTVTIGAN
ncbi:MAG: hypothetical protein ACYTGR_15915 [Planctomycetota bacterium]|jgi:hypothetical protein